MTTLNLRRRAVALIVLLFALTAPIAALAEPDGRGDPSPRPSAGATDATKKPHDPGSPSVAQEQWLREKLPASLLKPGPLQLPRWQWLALPVVLIVSLLFGLFLSRTLRAILRQITKRTAAEWDDRLVARAGSPLTLLCSAALYMASLPWLELYDPARRLVTSILQVLLFIGGAWLLVRAADVAAESVGKSPWAHSYPASRSLVPLGSRVLKVLLLIFAALALLTTLGYQVTTLVAGLGIGGLALALAAQKTVENLFGAFSIGIDQPLREGDYVAVEGVQGTVETIGLRSTRIRSLERTLIAIPNGKLAEMRIESYAARDRIRLACKLGLVYSTSSQQLRQVLVGLEAVLRAQPKLRLDDARVHFVGYGQSSLDIEVEAWFETTLWEEFLDIRQEVLLAFMTEVEAAGSAFAYPTRTIHVGSLPAPAEKVHAKSAALAD